MFLRLGLICVLLSCLLLDRQSLIYWDGSAATPSSHPSNWGRRKQAKIIRQIEGRRPHSNGARELSPSWAMMRVGQISEPVQVNSDSDEALPTNTSVITCGFGTGHNSATTYSYSRTLAEIQADLVVSYHACMQTHINKFFRSMGQRRCSFLLFFWWIFLFSWLSIIRTLCQFPPSTNIQSVTIFVTLYL